MRVDYKRKGKSRKEIRKRRRNDKDDVMIMEKREREGCGCWCHGIPLIRGKLNKSRLRTNNFPFNFILWKVYNRKRERERYFNYKDDVMIMEEIEGWDAKHHYWCCGIPLKRGNVHTMEREYKERQP